MKGLLFLAWALLVASFGTGRAQAATPDWKFFGTASFDGGTLCFYDAAGVKHQAEGHVRAETACLLEKEFDTVDIQGAILDQTSRKLAAGYVPPLATVGKLTANQIITVTGFEQTADIADLKPRAKIGYEIDCLKGLSRQLHAEFTGGGESRSTPSEWHQVQPTGNGAILLKLLCGGR